MLIYVFFRYLASIFLLPLMLEIRPLCIGLRYCYPANSLLHKISKVAGIRHLAVSGHCKSPELVANLTVSRMRIW
ncbi:hypothetical protein OBBRIDRAFT_158129 [Obba rivulosa]|uniref:Uncharacterized protein n=1 Tax=Obba rivulosa TaxID=1052685 RepID=A0A8E2ASV0_9APHY|nr:hypothetical protein OBBRIDRAFT_158129 [Obba rivulosa]